MYPVVEGKTQEQLKLEDSFKEASVIFYAEYIGDGELKLLEVFRGEKLLTNQVISVKEEVTTCDYYFQQNKKYLIFGTINPAGKLYTNICFANKEYSSKEDLKFINQYL